MTNPSEKIQYGRLEHPVSDNEVTQVMALLSHLTTTLPPPSEVADNLSEIALNRRTQFMAVAVMSGQMVGMSTLTLKPIPTEKTAYVDDVVVRPEARGQGVATKLMALLETFAIENGYRQLQLTSSDRRVEAIQLYEGLGFILKDTNFFIKDLGPGNAA